MKLWTAAIQTLQVDDVKCRVLESSSNTLLLVAVEAMHDCGQATYLK